MCFCVCWGEIGFMLDLSHCCAGPDVTVHRLHALPAWSQGVDAPMSGLIAMLAAASILGNAGGAGAAPRYAKRIAFAALAGEPWGYMGSKRMLFEVSREG
jgi:hypothetical protein